MTKLPETISLSIEEDKIIIKSDYSRDLIDRIKILDKNQREWCTPVWKILLNDPNQKDDEQTNLEFMREVCQEVASLEGWIFNDYSFRVNYVARRHKNKEFSWWRYINSCTTKNAKTMATS